MNPCATRHEALRTVLETERGEPRQRVLTELELELPVLDLGTLTVDRREPEAARVASGPGEMACTRIPFGPSSADTYLTELSKAAFATPIML